MRKFILITAMVLASATAQAGPMRSLTLASNDQPAAGRAKGRRTEAGRRQPAASKPVAAPSAAEAPAATPAPTYVARPAPVEPAATAPTGRDDKTRRHEGRKAEAPARVDRSARDPRTASPRHLLVGPTVSPCRSPPGCASRRSTFLCTGSFSRFWSSPAAPPRTHAGPGHEIVVPRAWQSMATAGLPRLRPSGCGGTPPRALHIAASRLN